MGTSALILTEVARWAYGIYYRVVPPKIKPLTPVIPN